MIYYDPQSGNRLALRERDRWDGKNVYDDLDAQARVICMAEQVSLTPPGERIPNRWPLKIHG